jgi:membrane protease YdiL (CAAX protease family)
LVSLSGYLPDPRFCTSDNALKRLWWEFIPCAITLILTAIYGKATKDIKIHANIMALSMTGSLLGIALGIIWITLPVAILHGAQVLGFISSNKIHQPFIWIIALLLNAAMQEYLVHGYIFFLLRARTNTIIAIIISAALFTIMHAEAFETGIIAVLNVVTTAIFMSLLLLYTGSILVPIIVHFIWNTTGGIILGYISLPTDYPHLLNITLEGNPLLTGGLAGLEGSMVVLLVNCVLVATTARMILQKARNS